MGQQLRLIETFWFVGGDNVQSKGQIWGNQFKSFGFKKMDTIWFCGSSTFIIYY
jgi:hypothetical protein